MTTCKTKFCYSLIFLTIAFVSYGQDSAVAIPKIQFGLKDLTQITRLKDLLNGEFVISDGFGGYSFTIDEKGLFKKRDFSCLDDRISDSGIYRFNGKHQLELVSKSEKNTFIVYQFDKFYFLVSSRKNSAFEKDFLSTSSIYFRTGSTKTQDPRYTDQFFIAFSLMKNYLTKLD